MLCHRRKDEQACSVIEKRMEQVCFIIKESEKMATGQ